MIKAMQILLVPIMLISLAACEKNHGGAAGNISAQPGNIAPDFALRDINGKEIKLSGFRGKVVLLEFWATWCPPCRSSVPELVAIQDKYKDRGLIVMGVSVDEGQGLPAKLSEFSKEFRINYTVLIADDNINRAYNVSSIPMIFLIDKEGKIIKFFMGSTEDFETTVSALIDKYL